MKKWIVWMCLLVLTVSLCGCGGTSAAKVIQEREERIFGYSWTSEDVEALAAIRHDEAMDKWANEVADKIAQDQYPYYEVGSLMSCLEEAGYENEYLQEQAELCDIRWLVGLKEEAFAAGDWESVMIYLGKVQLHGKELPLESILPYEELKSWVEAQGGIEPVTENGMGGYYDDKQEQYQNDTQVDETLTTKSWSYEFFGDFMMRAYSKKNYRPTGEAWEEQLLSKYDYSSVGYYYKDEVIKLGEAWIKLHSQGKTILVDNGDGLVACLVTPKQIWIADGGLFTYE